MSKLRYTLKVPYKAFEEDCKTKQELNEYLNMMKKENYIPDKIIVWDNVADKIIKVQEDFKI